MRESVLPAETKAAQFSIPKSPLPCSRVTVASTYFTWTNWAVRSAWLGFLCAAACPSECIYIEADDDTRPPAERIGVDERYARFTTSTMGAVSFAVIASKLVQRMRLRTATTLSCPFTTAPTSEEKRRFADYQTSAVEELSGGVFG